MAVFKNVNTGKIKWDSIQFKRFRSTIIPNPQELASHLRRKHSTKWEKVFAWLAQNQYELVRNKSQIGTFLKELMLAVATNVAATFIHNGLKVSAYRELPLILLGSHLQTVIFTRAELFPLLLKAEFDDTESILMQMSISKQIVLD